MDNSILGVEYGFHEDLESGFDLSFDFSFDVQEKKDLKGVLSTINRLWRSGKKALCSGKPIDSSVYSLRRYVENGENKIEANISMYDVINKSSDFQSEADSFFLFMIYEAPWDVSKDVPLLLDLEYMFDLYSHSMTIQKFVSHISKTDPQKDEHVSAHHWDIGFFDKNDALEIRSLLAHSTTAYVNNKVKESKQQAAVRKAEEKKKAAEERL